MGKFISRRLLGMLLTMLLVSIAIFLISEIAPGAEDGTVRIEFEQPQSSVAPGQAAVFYEGSRVLGGCWISSALS